MTTTTRGGPSRAFATTIALCFALMIGGVYVAVADDEASNDEVPRWFTEEQVESGNEAYSNACAHCHGDDLQGNPPLVGDAFLERFDDVWALYDLTRETMPEDDPGALSDEAYGEIIAYVLERNGFPYGDDELDVDDRDALEAMTLDPDRVPDDEGDEEDEGDDG